MNMREIAARAGVSTATVSRVINGSAAVKDKKARRVREILEEVNYIPNPSATTLKYGRSNTFGVIIPDICNPFYGEFLGSFEDYLLEVDHEMLITSVQTPEKLEKSIRRMLMRKVDGVAIMASEFDTRSVEPLFRHKIPIVTVDRRKVEAGCSDVVVDFEIGFTEAANHLRALGHERVAYIGGTKGPHTSSIRARAFSKGLKRSGLKLHENLIRFGDYRFAGGELAITSLMKEKNPPTAVICANDMTAFGVYRGLAEMKLSAPHDVSVVGVDDVQLSQIIQPPLTTIRIPRKRFAKVCVDALSSMKEDVDRMGEQYTLPSTLIERESTAQPPVVRRE